MDSLPLPPGRCKAHEGEHRKEKASDLQHQDSCSSCRRLADTLGRSYSTSDGIMTVAEPPQHPAHCLRPLELSNLRHRTILTTSQTTSANCLS